jgi:hypothetical protein
LGVTLNQLLYLEISCRRISFSSVEGGAEGDQKQQHNDVPFLIWFSLSFAACGRRFQERNQPLGIECLFDAPEDVIDAQVFFTKLDYPQWLPLSRFVRSRAGSLDATNASSTTRQRKPLFSFRKRLRCNVAL